MGFEQLASLKDQLAQQAKAEKLAKQPNKKTAPARKAEPVDPVVLVIGQLQKRFPKAFPKNPAPKLAMKIGIHRDLLEQSEQLGISKKALREAIKTWCWGNRYWACIVEDAVRVDLNGDETGRVTKEDAAQARGLETRRHKNKKPKQGASKPVAPELGHEEDQQ
jgi:ProP effector